MDTGGCLDFVKRNPNGFLATVDNGRPRVRPMTVWLADRTGFYFYTSRVKPLHEQLRSCAEVEIAFHEPGRPPDVGVILRLRGRVEFVTDPKIRRRLTELQPWLKKIGSGKPDCPTIAVFRLASGLWNRWTWENNAAPGPWVPFP